MILVSQRCPRQEEMCGHVLLPPGEGGPKGRMRAHLALTRRFAAPSPGGRGTREKPVPHLRTGCNPHSAWITETPIIYFSGLWKNPGFIVGENFIRRARAFFSAPFHETLEIDR